MTEEKKRIQLTVLTSSEVQTFRDCPHKWGLVYERGLRPKVAPRALKFGGAVHKGLEEAIRFMGHPDFVGLSPEQLHDALAPRAHTAINREFGEWYKRRLAAGLDDEALMELANEAEETQATARWMVSHYLRKHAADWTNLVAVGVELPFQVRLRDRRGYHSPHTAWAGVMDVVAYDRNVGDLVVFDHKTTSGDVSSVDRRVELDPQMGGYLYALRELLASGALKSSHREVQTILDLAAAGGSVATGRVIYNVLKKKRPSEPKVNKDGTVSVAAIDTFPELYEAALAAQVERGKPIEAKQQDVLDRLRSKGDTFLSRREFFRSDDEVDRWRRETMVEARRVREAIRDEDARTRNPGHCTMPWSMACAYRAVCLDPDAPEHLEHFEVAPRHAEVEAAKERDDEESAP